VTPRCTPGDDVLEPLHAFLTELVGAGKSTTMRMIGATLDRTSGTLSVAGLDPGDHGPRVRAHLGVVPQQDNLDEDLRVRENLIFPGV